MEKAAIHSLSDGTSFQGTILTRQGATLELEAEPDQAGKVPDSPVFPSHALVEVIAGNLLFLGTVLREDARRVTLLLEHLVDLERVERVRQVWRRSGDPSGGHPQ